MLTVRSPKILPDAYETESEHNCQTWHHRSPDGLKCLHGFVLLPHEVPTARLRADRIPTGASADA